VVVVVEVCVVLNVVEDDWFGMKLLLYSTLLYSTAFLLFCFGAPLPVLIWPLRGRYDTQGPR
jgi:hypothetical protein